MMSFANNRHTVGFLYDNRKTSVYHTLNGDCALFHTSKTAKKIKVILHRAPCQNVNELLKQCTIAVNSVINTEDFSIIFAVFLYFQVILSILKMA